MKTSARVFSLLFIAVTVVMAGTLTGCRTSKGSAGTGTDIASMTLVERARDVASRNQPWTQLNVPLKVAVKSPQKLSVSGRMYMRRDRDIYITLRVLGMEVANLYVDSDSVFAVDKIHKYYIAEPVKDIFAGVSLSIGDIQDVLLGRPFINSSGAFTADDIRQVTLSVAPYDSWTLTPRPLLNGRAAYSFEFSSVDNALQALKIDVDGKQYGCNYALPADVDGMRFMQQLTIATMAGKTAINATLTCDFDKVKYEVPSSARRHIPSNYKRLSPRALAKAFE